MKGGRGDEERSLLLLLSTPAPRRKIPERYVRDEHTPVYIVADPRNAQSLVLRRVIRDAADASQPLSTLPTERTCVP